MAMLGTQELLLIFLAVVLLFGASKLPELAKSMGRSMGEFRRGQMEIDREISLDKASAFSPARTDLALTRTQRMAQGMGIDPTGKTEDQLLSEIERKLERK